MDDSREDAERAEAAVAVVKLYLNSSVVEGKDDDDDPSPSGVMMKILLLLLLLLLIAPSPETETDVASRVLPPPLLLWLI